MQLGRNYPCGATFGSLYDKKIIGSPHEARKRWSLFYTESTRFINYLFDIHTVCSTAISVEIKEKL